VFTLSVYPEKHLMRFSVDVSLPDGDALAAFHRDLLAEADRLHADGGTFDLIVDLRNAAVQSREGGEAIRTVMEGMRNRGLRRAAHLVASTLKKLQIERLALNDDFRAFTDEAAALAWLREGARVGGTPHTAGVH
jgi:hypothetical protein